MSVNLVKGQKVELRKQTGDTLRSVTVALGWDEAAASAKPAGLFSSLFGGNKEPEAFDCDASAFVCQNGKLVVKNDIVYFANLTHSSGAVRHMGDNLTGAGAGDDEQIIVNLEQLPPAYDKIVFVVNIFQAIQRRQHFGMIRNAYIRIIDDKGQEMCRYDLTERCEGMTALIFGEIYRHNGTWKFNAIGQPTSDNDVTQLSNRFK